MSWNIWPFIWEDVDIFSNFIKYFVYEWGKYMNRNVSYSSFDNALLKISRKKVESFFQRLRNISCSYLTLLLETMLYPKYNGNHCIQFEFKNVN